MAEKNQSKHHIGLLMAACLAVLSVFGWFVVSDKTFVQKQLVTNYGEIKRIDAVLTHSAMLVTATGNGVHQRRYVAHIGQLENLIGKTIELSDEPSAQALIAETSRANTVIGSIESQAMAAAQGAPNAAAHATLLAVEYQQNKIRYVAKLDQIFDELCGAIDRQVILMRLAFVGSVLAFLLTGFLVLRLMADAKIAAQARKNQSEQVHMMSALVRTFMDLQNNLLNNMVYFRTKAAYNLPFDDQEVSLIDREIDQAKEKLAEIAKTEFAQTRDLGGIVVMVKDVPGQCDTPEYANVA